MRRTIWVVGGLGLLWACHRARTSPETTPVDAAPPARETKVEFHEDPEAQGLTMRLYEATPADGGADRPPLAAATPLSEAQAAALIARLPPMEGVDETTDFALREGPVPPPRTGATVALPFPPLDAAGPPPVAETGPLAVVRKSPEGDVPMAPHLSVTFSQPMVAVSSQEEAAKTVPVKLTPTPPGKWRWLGAKTLLFDPDPRFPMATRYTVEIPAGTKSAKGDPLAAPVSWTFTTPPPTLEQAWPKEEDRGRRGLEGNPQPLDPVLFFAFDQAVSPEAILAKARLEGAGDAVPLRPATAEEVAASPEVAPRAKAAEAGRWVAAKPTRPLQGASRYVVTLPAGTPSAEGPLTTTKAQSFAFRTRGPMEAVELSCWGQKPCPPSSPWALTFTNPLDADAFDPAQVAVEPAVPGLEISAEGQEVRIWGAFAGRTTYTVRVAAGVRDVFGQALAAGKTFSVDVGPAEQTLSGPGDTFVVLDPAAPPAASFFTVNHKALKVTVHRVRPEDWTAWTAWLNKWRWEDAKPGPLPGEKVADRTVQVAGEPDRMAETAIDLAPYLQDGVGHLIVRVEPTTQPKERWRRQSWLGWVQATKLGVTAFVDDREVTGWVTTLADGKPVAGAQLSAVGKAAGVAETGADGLGAVGLVGEPAAALVARVGKDAALLPADVHGWGGGGWVRVQRLEQLRWFTFDDKHLYKPGETVHVRGWIRRMPPGEGSELEALGDRVKTVRWRAWSSQGNPMGEGAAKVSGLGGFTLDVPLPKTPNLGTARVDLFVEGDEARATTHFFDVQEYRTPEFEVTARGGDGVYALGEDATVEVEAAYYAGGALPAAPVAWTATATPATFVPPGRSDWSFGPWSPWWWHGFGPEEHVTTSETLAGVTDAAGVHRLGIHFEALEPPRPMTVTAEASVQDVNRQAWAASRSFLVHPAAWYVGVRTARPFVEAGKPVEVETLVVDREGKEVTGAEVEVALRKLAWKRTARGWEEVPEDVGQARIPAGKAGGKASLVPPAGGTYLVVAEIRDANGRRNRTEVRVWVAGAELTPDRGVERERVTLVPEKETYAVGDTATLVVQAPFWPAEGVLTLRADGLLEARRFAVEGPSTTLSIPILEGHVPDLTVAVDVVGARPRSGDDGKVREDLPPRVAYASGTLTFEVPPLTRALTVSVSPATARLDPGAATTVDVAVADAKGAPVAGAELAVFAVDEAVLALSGYRLPDPLAVFYAARGDGVTTRHLREFVALADPLRTAAAEGGLGASGYGRGGGAVARNGHAESKMMRMMDGPGAMPPPSPTAAAPMEMAEAAADMDVSGPTGAPIALRSDFAAVALWAPEVVTDASGHASVPLKLPDSLTRYRVMAVAVAGARQFGAGEADVTARLPLMVRPSAPRFLNFGDRVELPVVLQNQTDAPMQVDVALRAGNASLLGKVTDPLPAPSRLSGGVAGQRVTVPANDRVEVRFPVAAALAGTARFQLAAASGKNADAASVELPVWTPATTEAFATYGTLTEGLAVQPVAPPKDVWPQFGGLEVTVSSTQLQALTDAVLYLVKYPFECNEQVASRVLAVAALRDVLTAFGSKELPPPDALAKAVGDDLDRLQKRQNGDGGFAFWRRGDESWPYVSIHAAHAMVRAKEKGWDVDAGTLERALRYLDRVERHLPKWYSKESKWALRAYALHVLHLAGKPDAKKAKALLAEAGVDALPMEAMGWLLPTLQEGGATKEVAAIRGWLANHVEETAGAAHFVTGYSDGEQVLLHSDRRVDGVLLEALLRTAPKDDLIPKLATGLLAHRTAGRWANTNESALVLLALDRYFAVMEGTTPDFVARVWLGDGYAGDHAFRGRTTERAQIDVPMAQVQRRGPADLLVQKDGAGRLYWRVGMRYAPKDLDAEAADYGFTVTRTYEAVDDPADVRRGDDGVWRVKAGARVRVRLEMVAPARRYHVALVDPLPAGLEVLNPDLATTGAIPQDPNAQKGPFWWWMRTWVEHENLRDERVEAFASLLWDGVHAYTYVARATTPGDFVVPPAKAEEMYSPETFGRSAGDRVIVE